MKAQNTLGIKFIIRKNKMKDDKVPLYVSVTINGKRVELSLKQFIVLEDWNPRKEKGKRMNPEIIQLNRYLQQVKSRIVECYR
jgi:hypothetical protein